MPLMWAFLRSQGNKLATFLPRLPRHQPRPDEGLTVRVRDHILARRTNRWLSGFRPTPFLRDFLAHPKLIAVSYVLFRAEFSSSGPFHLPPWSSYPGSGLEPAAHSCYSSHRAYPRCHEPDFRASAITRIGQTSCTLTRIGLTSCTLRLYPRQPVQDIPELVSTCPSAKSFGPQVWAWPSHSVPRSEHTVTGTSRSA